MLADEAGSLNLPAAISLESLAKASARGEATAVAAAGVEDGNVHARATATLDQPLTITSPVTTGSIGDLGSGATSQISTGVGNIQQGVSATAISF